MSNANRARQGETCLLRSTELDVGGSNPPGRANKNRYLASTNTVFFIFCCPFAAHAKRRPKPEGDFATHLLPT